MNGSSPQEGRVEVCYDGVWGTVCHDFWSSADASVACRQLGFSSWGAIAHTNAAYGEGTGVVLLDDVRCTGEEAKLLECVQAAIGVTTCDHERDAGIACGLGTCIAVRVHYSGTSKGVLGGGITPMPWFN